MASVTLMVLVISSPLVVDQILVSAGKMHAAALCERPGPLKISDLAKWNEYSLAIHAALRSGGASDRYGVASSVRRKLNIKLIRERVYPGYVWFRTASYIEDSLQFDGYVIAKLSYYRSDNAGPLSALFLDGVGNNFTCIVKRPKYYMIPEFSLF